MVISLSCGGMALIKVLLIVVLPLPDVWPQSSMSAAQSRTLAEFFQITAGVMLKDLLILLSCSCGSAIDSSAKRHSEMKRSLSSETREDGRRIVRLTVPD